MCSSSASVIWRPMVSTGLSEVMGSWKIMAILLPRTLRISSSLSLSRSRPVKEHLAAHDLARGLGMRRMTDSTLTLLPQPLSPTMPSVSPSFTKNETPSTALTTPSCVKNWVLSPFTSSNGIDDFSSQKDNTWRTATGLSAPRFDLSPAAGQAWVQNVAQSIAHQVPGQHKQDDGHPGDRRRSTSSPPAMGSSCGRS